jgi:hypothetical protein
MALLHEAPVGGVLVYYSTVTRRTTVHTAQQHMFNANFGEMNLGSPLAQIPSIDRAYLHSIHQNVSR